MKSRLVVLIVRVDFEAPGVRGARAQQRYAGRIIEIRRNTRTVMVRSV
ncbi:hypothetical protein [Brevundimonas basaltis]|uniref:Uncharacterized protein n=1 Tax=Brevundimonas basaltis TaxID=472166 RepID=A0A7W8HZA7_9CAUL|nr:hypothetical protein [Brevundimonas basaltis]MBB5292434.1 hypothetical protein [Brevundimonas basaltis]